MSMTAAVAGASGAVGGELLRLLSAHPRLVLGSMAAGTQAGKPVTDIHPELSGLAGRVFDRTDPERLAEADVVFLALPRGESARVAAALPDSVRVVDLGPDYRLCDGSVWERFYDEPYAGRWPYGLPELAGARKQIAVADRIASPSCYATAVILALAPLVAAGLAEPSDIVITVLAGTSGAGRSANPEHLASAVANAIRGYQVGGDHGSVPEIEQELSALGDPATVSLIPVLAPIPRGIMATCSIRLTGAASTAQLRDALATAYRGEPFVRLLPGDRWPSTAAVARSNLALLQAAADPRAGRAVVMAALDNLGKGAAGQAIQIANLMLNMPEHTGLAP
ncbi:MAG: N-acetyl-gamma-glutamyl-phosphate reductase [Pseudonocardiales bacterium]|jgi:N-acetyl-gamma-glutamyl-phosphate reductase|nr:N-acetyl-gamma-glutamyl-phosphate reductase [Pseudonocardiales bacterium]